MNTKAKIFTSSGAIKVGPLKASFDPKWFLNRSGLYR